jgi:hypothetical protein
MQVNQKKISRTVYRVDLKEFLNVCGRIATGNFPVNIYEAMRVVRKCVYAQKGNEKRELTEVEAAKLIKQR